MERVVGDMNGIELEEYVNNYIKKNNIMIFSKSWCPFCKKVEQIFDGLGMNYFSLDLAELDTSLSEQITNILKEMTSQATVPNVFIHGVHVGGCSNVQQAVADGTIYEMYQNKFLTHDYDLIVIGGGSGGLAAAKEAVKYGKKVAVVDYVKPSPRGSTWGLGGTCVNVGCIPKKLMHRAALIYEDIQDAKIFGWNISITQEDHRWSDMVESVQNYIKSLNWNYRKQLRDKNIVYFNELAQFKDEYTIVLSKDGVETRTVTSQNFIIAVGGRPFYPKFPGAIEFCISSDDIFQLKEFPGKTLIIGASYIALECAGFLANMNVDCTVMVRSMLLRGFDRTMAKKVEEMMQKRQIKFVYNCVPSSVTLREKSSTMSLYEVRGVFENDHEYKDCFNTVLLATGREPCTNGLGLDSINVKINERNKKIIVDDWDRTSVKTIFAIGDVVDDKPELTPVAIQAGIRLARRLYALSEIKMDWNYVPTTIFTPIEYGCVGYSEERAREVFETEIEVFHSTFRPLEKALSANDNDCYAKLVCTVMPNKLLQVVGLHILAPNAGEIVQGFALAIKMGVTKNNFDALVGIHPTIAEIFTTLDVTKSSQESEKASGC